MTTDTPTDDPRRTVLETLRANADGVTDDLLAASVTGRTDADLETVREAIDTLERRGEIYRANGTWKLTTL